MLGILVGAGALLVLALLVGAFALGHARARAKSDLSFQATYRVQERGFWLWKSQNLYSVIQYTHRGVPIGNPVEHLFRSSIQVNDEVIQAAVCAAASMALGSPVPLQVLKGLHDKRRAGSLPEGDGAQFDEVPLNQSRRATKTSSGVGASGRGSERKGRSA